MAILTPQAGQVSPQILQEAMAGHIPGELKVNTQQVMDILDGRTSSSNPENEAYRLLLVASCNHLHSIFPFLFEAIDDYSELLLPDDLTSEFSIVEDVIDGMTIEDCQQVEILGWLYQFYISEKNNELISSKKTYKKDELAPASQLFTPKWIVQYMVDNTLGQLWSEVNPTTNILKDLEFYIEPAYKDQLDERENKAIEEITFFDPCVGSGHILTYAFDVFYKMYEEMGYSPTEIPSLILKNNLYGVDIDQRATQIASFVLMMKGREKYRRFFRKEVQHNIYYYEDFERDDKFENATALGSLIHVAPEEYKKIKVDDSLFGKRQEKLRELYKLLGRSYDVVVTNPPYIGSKRMEKSLKEYVSENFEITNSDLFATFILRCLELCKEHGLAGYMTPFVWMFISSYQDLREEIINNHLINNLVQLEYSGFDGATVPICTFTLRRDNLKSVEGSYIRLSDFKGSKNQAPKTLHAIKNQECGWFHKANQVDFLKVPGYPIGYWVNDQFRQTFQKFDLIKDQVKCIQGIITGNTNRFLRFWFEINDKNKSINSKHFQTEKYWIAYTKGGAQRKWFGNNIHVINWKNEGNDLTRSRNTNSEFYLKPCITWTLITSADFTARYCDTGFLWDVAGSIGFPKEHENRYLILAVLCSKLSNYTLNVLNPTLNTNIENVDSIPVADLTNDEKDRVNLIAKNAIQVSKNDWDSRETSWDFQQNELIRFNKEGGIDTLEEAYEHYRQYWTNKFFQLHQNEEQLNRQFIEIYGLQDELSPEVPLDEITILQEELDSKKLKKKDSELRRQKSEGRNPDLPFKDKEVFAQFISYAVGCIFGRYSLDKEGLILANQGETLEDYFEKVYGETHPSIPSQEGKFIPDDDNIIPVLDDEWFEDDIVFRFHEFLKASFGEEYFQKNLAFIEEHITHGDIRKYFDKTFYTDHYKRYNKRPIYWKFSSPKGHFSVLIYMHRYTPDTLNNILNNYLREFVNKLKTRKEQMQHLENTGSASEKAQASKEIDKLNEMIADCQTYEREILYPLASERIEMDLDDGVLVNYNLFGKAVEEIKSVNDKKKKKKVKEFDWIDGGRVR
jgi:type II restriction/modification system DNA methylase subunit YeeA